MKRIHKMSDRIPVKVDDVTVTLKPLTFDQKNEITQAMIEGRDKKDFITSSNALKLAMKYSVRGISGVEGYDGKPYELAFDEKGDLTDECIDDLMNIENSAKLRAVCIQLNNGIPSTFVDGATGKPLEGVELAQKDQAALPNG